MARVPFVAGNWKMFTDVAEAQALARGVVEAVAGVKGCEVAVCPPFVNLAAVAEIVRGSNVALGGQNFHVAEKDGAFVTTGAYTGEIGPGMLKAIGATCVILGHSERRQFFHETDAGVNRKVRAAFEAGLLPIICVGETLEEREAGNTQKVVETHVRGAYKNLPADKARQTVIAYEPVWAIGTGKTATPAQAQEVHAFIRGLLKELYGAEVAEAIRLQYGGSVKPDNARELFGQADIDGGLIGGAALKADSFAAIVKAAV